MFREAGMASAEIQYPSPGYSLPPAISWHVVRLFSDYTGRGPTKARTMISDNVIVCVTHDTLTKGERRLVEKGEAELVVTIRRKFQRTMHEDLVSGIELLTGRTVVSFPSDHDADHDYAAEVFVLDAAPGGQGSSADPEARLENQNAGLSRRPPG
jgi:uncharacterized protein YbcI